MGVEMYCLSVVQGLYKCINYIVISDRFGQCIDGVLIFYYYFCEKIVKEVVGVVYVNKKVYINLYCQKMNIMFDYFLFLFNF